VLRIELYERRDSSCAGRHLDWKYCNFKSLSFTTLPATNRVGLIVTLVH